MTEPQETSVEVKVEAPRPLTTVQLYFLRAFYKVQWNAPVFWAGVTRSLHRPRGYLYVYANLLRHGYNPYAGLVPAPRRV